MTSHLISSFGKTNLINFTWFDFFPPNPSSFKPNFSRTNS